MNSNVFEEFIKIWVGGGIILNIGILIFCMYFYFYLLSK